MCTGANCNETLQVNIPLATPGADGASAYLYIASADNSSGLNFTYPADPAQHYIAFLKTTSPITSPAAGDFTGLWTKYVGDDGTNGTSGTNGLDGVNNGIPFNFLNYGLAGNPGTGNISFNGSALNLTNIINISDTDVNSVNIHAYLTALNTSTSTLKAFIKLTKKGDESKYAIFSLFSATDTGTYFALSVTYISCTSVNVFTGSDDLYLTVYMTGDKGAAGIPGPAGAFIIGTIAGGTQAYPAVATFGSAYRATADGTLSDGGLGVTNVKRFFLYDVLYCIADSTSSDGTKWILWQGFPRPFYPGSGTDSYIQNTVSPGTATGASAISLNDSSAASGDKSIAGVGGTSSGFRSVAVGAGSTASGQDAIAIGSNTQASGISAASIGYGGNAKAAGSVALGQFSDIEAGATGAVNASYFGQTDSAGRQSSQVGKEGRVSFPGEHVQGHGNFDAGKLGQAQSMLIPQASETIDATPNVLSFMPGETAGVTIPLDSAWMVEGTILAARTVTEAVASWIFKVLVKNIAGTAAIVGSVLYLDPVTGTYQNVSTQFANDAGMSTATLGITVSSANLVVTATGIAGTAIRWSGILKAEQVGWF